MASLPQTQLQDGMPEVTSSRNHGARAPLTFFYNPQRKHVRNGMLSPINFEQQQKLGLQGV